MEIEMSVTPEADLENVELSVRAYSVLRRVGLRTVGEVAALNWEELLAVRMLDERSFFEVLDMLREGGLTLSQTVSGTLPKQFYGGAGDQAPALPEQYFVVWVGDVRASAWLAKKKHYEALLELSDRFHVPLYQLCVKLPKLYRSYEPAAQQLTGAVERYAEELPVYTRETALHELDLSVLAYYSLRRAGYETLGQVADLTLEELRSVLRFRPYVCREVFNTFLLSKPVPAGSGNAPEPPDEAVGGFPSPEEVAAADLWLRNEKHYKQLRKLADRTGVLLCQLIRKLPGLCREIGLERVEEEADLLWEALQAHTEPKTEDSP